MRSLECPRTTMGASDESLTLSHIFSFRSCHVRGDDWMIFSFCARYSANTLASYNKHNRIDILETNKRIVT